MLDYIVKIEILNDKGEILENGTGFLYGVSINAINTQYYGSIESALPCIITAKHLLKNEDFNQLKLTILNNIHNNFEPFELIFNLNEIISIPHESIDICLIYLKNLELYFSRIQSNYRSKLNTSNVAYKKESSIPKYISPKFLSYEDLLFYSSPKKERRIDAISNPLVLGYVLDDKYKLNVPLEIRSSFATYDLGDIFILQTVTSKGLSGSPVFATSNYDFNEKFLIGIISEKCSNSSEDIEGLCYVVSSFHIYYLEQALLAKIPKEELEKRKSQYQNNYTEW